MKYIEIITSPDNSANIEAISKQIAVEDYRIIATAMDGLEQSRFLVSDEKLQPLLDALQKISVDNNAIRVVVLPVETSFPKASDAKRSEEDSAIAAREAIYDLIEKNSRLDFNFLTLVVLSTIVAAIGLIENNVAVVVGSMVIAPLLGPNLALSLGTALGDISLMKSSMRTNAAGVALTILLSITVGFFWRSNIYSSELMARTDVGIDSIILALASGAAAALSLTTGLSSVLVGVMVAVALLPPAATLGIMLGQGNYHLAVGAALLLTVNVVCVNLSSKIVFFLKGISPRTWMEQEKAKRAMATFSIAWLLTLILLFLAIYGRTLVG